MTPNPDDTTPSEDMLIRYNADLEGATSPAEGRVIFDRYVAEFPGHRAVLLEFLDAALRRMSRFAAPVPVPRLLEPGDRLDAFTIVDFAAAGGMGEIYEAKQDDVERSVALKVSTLPISELETTARNLAKHFIQEYRVPAKLHQTNVVPIYFAGHAEIRGRTIWYYVMQYIDGASLKDVLDGAFHLETSSPQSRGTPPLVEVVLKHLPASERWHRRSGDEPDRVTLTNQGQPDACEVLPAHPPAVNDGSMTRPVSRTSRAHCVDRFQSHGRDRYYESVACVVEDIGDAVGYLHANGYRHRDIKPANAMLAKDGRCYLIDFGLADKTKGVAPEDKPWHDASSCRMIESGTVEYMAPEQFATSGRPPVPIGPTADVYSLGATLYELLTFRPAFRAVDPVNRFEVVEKIVAGDYKHPRELVANVPTGLVKICEKAMAVNPAHRYPTGKELAADLKRWRNWQPTQAHPGRWTLRPSRLWVWRNRSLALLLLLATAVVTGAPVLYSVMAAQYQERERKFQEAVQESRDVQNAVPHIGWSDESERLLLGAKRLLPDTDLGDHVLKTRIGPDAKIVRRHELPEGLTDKIVGLGSVAFGPNGQVLAGGFQGESKAAVDLSPALLFGANLGPAPAVSTLPGAGPVAFADANTPVQLVLPTGNRRHLTLWHVAKNQAVAEIPVPESFLRVESMVAALSDDARLAAVSATSLPNRDGQRTGETILWAFDPKTPGAAPKRLRRWDLPASALAFSGDGKYLAAGTHSGSVGLHDTVAGTDLFSIADNRLPVLSLAFGRNVRKDATDTPRIVTGGLPGWLLAVGTASGTATVWNLETKVQISVIQGALYFVNALAFTPDGSEIVTAGAEAPVRWDVATATPTFALTPEKNGTLTGYKTGVAVSPDGRRVAFTSSNEHGGSRRNRLEVVEFVRDRGIPTFRGLSGKVDKVVLSPNAKWVAASSHNWEVAVWDLATGRLAFVWDVPVGWTVENSDLAFDEREETIYFASGERVTRLNLTTGKRVGRWVLPVGLNDQLLISKGRNPFLVRRELNGPIERNRPRPMTTIRARELLEGGKMAERYSFPADFGPMNSITVSADGRYLATSTEVEQGGSRFHLFDGPTGKRIDLPKEIQLLDVGSFAFSPSGSTVGLNCNVTNAASQTRLYNLPDLTLGAVHPGNHLGALDAGVKLSLATSNTETLIGLTLYRVGEPKPLVTFDTGRLPNLHSRHLSPDGRYGYWGRTDGTVLVADINQCLEHVVAFQAKSQK